MRPLKQKPILLFIFFIVLFPLILAINTSKNNRNLEEESLSQDLDISLLYEWDRFLNLSEKEQGADVACDSDNNVLI